MHRTHGPDLKEAKTRMIGKSFCFCLDVVLYLLEGKPSNLISFCDEKFHTIYIRQPLFSEKVLVTFDKKTIDGKEPSP